MIVYGSIKFDVAGLADEDEALRAISDHLTSFAWKYAKTGAEFDVHVRAYDPDHGLDALAGPIDDHGYRIHIEPDE